jgi:aminodeoxyfutalosine synthase
MTDRRVTPQDDGPRRRPVDFPLDRDGLARLLTGPHPLEPARQADQLRRERHGGRTTYVTVAHLDVQSGASACPICGETQEGASAWACAPAASLALAAAVPALAQPPVSDLHVLLPPHAGAPGDDMVRLTELLETLAQALHSLPGAEPDLRPRRSTLQLGCASDLIRRLDTGRTPDAQALRALSKAGLQVVSDGTHPAVHPTQGPQAQQRWEGFWRAAAEAGLRGNASVVYGPHIESGAVLGQIVAIGRLQAEVQVFQSVAPVAAAERVGRAERDLSLTGGFDELKFLAACRLGLAEVPHVRVLYNRSDLKMAQLMLACGADDLEGRVTLAPRDRKADLESADLTETELRRWLAEERFEPVHRNGIFEES